MGSFSKYQTKFRNLKYKAFALLSLKVFDHGNLIMFIAGCWTVICGLNSISHAAGTIPIDTSELVRGTCTLFYLIEGAYGALLATVAGIGAIVSSAFGQYRAAYNFLIVSISSFILRAMVSMWFGVPTNARCITLWNTPHTTTGGGTVTPPDYDPCADDPSLPGC